MNYISERVKANVNVPIIFFTKGGSFFLKDLKQSFCDAIGVDWSVTIEKARHYVGVGKVLQGNFDPAFLYGSSSYINESVKFYMDFIQSDALNNYIVNLGHGVYPDIDPEKVKIMVDSVREFSVL